MYSHFVTIIINIILNEPVINQLIIQYRHRYHRGYTHDPDDVNLVIIAIVVFGGIDHRTMILLVTEEGQHMQSETN